MCESVTATRLSQLSLHMNDRDSISLLRYNLLENARTMDMETEAETELQN